MAILWPYLANLALLDDLEQWFLTRGEFPTRGEFEKLQGGILILHSENPKHCVLPCSTIKAANFQTLVWDLRIFVKLQTFLLLFYICWKPRLFCISHHKTTSKHPKTQKFRPYFAKTFCDSRLKLGKRPHTAGSSCAWAGLWPAVTRTLSISRSF